MSDAPKIGEIWLKIAKKLSSSLLLLLSRFVFTVYLITSMFPLREGWLHAQSIGPAAQYSSILVPVNGSEMNY